MSRLLVLEDEIGFQTLLTEVLGSAGHDVVSAQTGQQALGLAVTKLHREHKIPLTRIVELFTAGPARVFDLRGRGSLAKGNHADVTIFDSKKRWTFEAAKSRSLSHNTPFDGWQFTGKVVATVVGGKIIYRTD